jgi:hypothetical protein
VTNAAQPKIFPTLSPLDLERCVSTREAATLLGVSPDTLKRHYSHIIRKVSPRRNVVKLRDLLARETAT